MRLTLPLELSHFYHLIICHHFENSLKMATSLTDDVLRADNLAVVTAFDMVNARQVRELLRTRWKEISVQMDNKTMLFLMGIHGSKDGNLGPLENNVQTMKNQVQIIQEIIIYIQ